MPWQSLAPGSLLLLCNSGEHRVFIVQNYKIVLKHQRKNVKSLLRVNLLNNSLLCFVIAGALVLVGAIRLFLRRTCKCTSCARSPV